MSTGGRAAAGHDLQRVHHLVQRIDADDVAAAEHRVVDPGVAREGAAVGERESARLLALAEFQGDERDARPVRRLRGGHETFALAHRLQHETDGGGFGASNEKLEVVGEAGHQLVAHRDADAETQRPMVSAQSRPCGAAVGQQADAAGPVQSGQAAHGQTHVVDGVEQAHAIRSAGDHAGLPAEACHALRKRGAATPRIVEAAEQDDRPDASARGVGDGRLDAAVADTHDRAIDGAGKRLQRGVAGVAQHLAVAWIDREDVAGEPRPGDVPEHPVAHRALARGGADHRDAPGRHQGREAPRRTRHARQPAGTRAWKRVRDAGSRMEDA